MAKRTIIVAPSALGFYRKCAAFYYHELHRHLERTFSLLRAAT